ncbi:MAG: methyltransferase domain-containing protein [Flavobacteriaceae bacterium]|nr:methyltransferase domain-containing protein [Flavobacteriaceae bacterium]
MNREFWEQKYQSDDTGWDLGAPSPPITHYVDQIEDKSLKILIPGAGNAYEAAYLLKNGFTQVTVVDIAPSPINNLAKQYASNYLTLINQDFFGIEEQYDLILEQTFFCALQPSFREQYAKKMNELLIPGGKLAGLLFDFPLSEEGPPFGGDIQTYKALFSPYFKISTLTPSHNSVKPRLGRELFFIFEKK